MVNSIYDSCGISTSGEFLKSDYFARLKKLGDFDSATRVSPEGYHPVRVGGYHFPYLDFGISQIYRKYHYIIGMISLEISLKFK